MPKDPKLEFDQDVLSVSRRDRIVEVTYDRGDGLNALSMKGMTALTNVARSIAQDATCDVVVLKGKNVFSAGADLNDPEMQAIDEASTLEQRAAWRIGPDMCQAWADLEPITIAAIEGFCIGGAIALAAACDHRVVSRTAYFRAPEVPLGMNMSWRSVPRLVALVGPSRAKQLLILGKKLDAETSERWGLADLVTAPGEATSTALRLAADYAASPPLAARMTKQAIDVSAAPLGHATSFMDRDQFLLSRRTRDHAEAVAAFMEKRDAKFTGD